MCVLVMCVWLLLMCVSECAGVCGCVGDCLCAGCVNVAVGHVSVGRMDRAREWAEGCPR